MNKKLEDSLANLRRANASLHAAVTANPRSSLIVSAIIKNFEFNFELSWKAMRRLLMHHGITASSPRQSIAEAYRKGFLNVDDVWIRMIEDRNLTVRTYDENFANEMSKRIEEQYLSLFDDFLSLLQSEVDAL